VKLHLKTTVSGSYVLFQAPIATVRYLLVNNDYTPGNGYIDYDELHTVIKFCMDESTLEFSDDTLDELTRALFNDADEDSSGTITFEELKRELDRHPGVLENLTISAAKWLKPPAPQAGRRRWAQFIPHWMSRKYVRNNITHVSWLSAYFVVNLLLFVEAAVRHRAGVSAVAMHVQWYLQ
jgi:hypothetical protein